MNGKGEFYWPDGRIFKGEYRDDKKHGPGIFTWSDKRELKGIWREGDLVGDAVYRDAQGRITQLDPASAQTLDQALE